MAISYPLTPPAALKVARVNFVGTSVISRNVSPFTLNVQQYNWPGTNLSAQVELPPMKRADAEEVIGFLLNAARGTFYFRDYANGTERGNMSGSPVLDGAHAANVSTITVKSGSGSWAVGDWIQLGSTSTAKLHKITQVNSATSYEVFPLLRTTYTDGAAIVYSSAVGVFRLAQPSTEWSIDQLKIYGLNFSIVEELS